MAENRIPDGDAEKGRTPEGTGGNRAEAVIAAFGGIRPMAHKLGTAVSTVQGWKNRGVIPEGRHAEVREAAQRHGVVLDDDVLRASSESAQSTGESADAAHGTHRKEPPPASETEHAVAAEAEAAAAADRDTAAASPRPSESQTSAASASGAGGGAYAAADDSTQGNGEGTSAPPSPPPQEPRRSGGWLAGMLLGAAVFAIAVGGTVVTRDAWLPLIDDELAAREAPDEARLARIEQSMAELSDGLTTLDNRLAGVEERAVDDPNRVEALAQEAETATARLMEMGERLEQASTRMEASAQRIDQLSGRLERLEERVNEVADTAAPAEAAEEMADRLGRMEAQVEELAALGQRVEEEEDLRDIARSAAAHEVGRALAVANLRDALRFSEPFEAELEAARDAVSHDSDAMARLEALEPFAVRGIPTREQLAARFERVAREAVAADAEDRADSELVGGILRRLGDVVTVRPVGEDAEGTGAGPVLARAEARLQAGDLASAVEAVEQLGGAAREAMEGWLEQAQARMAAERSVAGLGKRLAQAAPSTAANGG